ncbi:MAG: hypothetical protein QXT67_08310 [Candidatus Bathyarchaeia archaeon]
MGGEETILNNSTYKVEKGLTWRSLLALLYIVFVFQPGLAYLQLMTGNLPTTAAIQWAAILLFIELSAVFAGRKLSLPEAIVIYLASIQTIKYWWFLAPTRENLTHPGWIYQLYLRYSPVTIALGISDKIPWFYAPLSPEPWIARTFFHHEWIPILLWTILFFITALFGDIVMNILTYHLYVVTEKLPFPLAHPIAVTSESLVKGDWSKMGVLAGVTIPAFFYSFVLYSLPLISEAFWGTRISVIPVPWVDYNTVVQSFLPAASFGISTDLAIIGLGFIIPLQASLGLFLGSLALYFFGNHLLVSLGITGFAREYEYGMSVEVAWQRSVLWAWAMPIVGFALAVGITPLLLRPDVVKRTLSALKSLGKVTDVPLKACLVLFLCSAIALSILDYWLAPDLPITIYLLLNIIWPFLLMLVIARGEGLGLSFTIPYVRELTIKAVGYGGIDAWFAPIYMPSSWTSLFKVCDMTRTSHRDFIIASIIVFPIALFFGFIVMQALWSLAPIPSSIYPGALYTWPVQATIQSIFISPEATDFFSYQRLFLGFITGAILYAIGSKLGFAPLVVGLAGGVYTPVPSAFATFMGAVIGLALQRLISESWWKEHAGIIYAGILLGEGLAVSIGAGLAIIMKSMWAEPF